MPELQAPRPPTSLVRHLPARTRTTVALLALTLVAAACHQAGPPALTGSVNTTEPSCAGPRLLVVDNQVGEDLDIYTSIDRRLVPLGSVGPGRAELALPGPEARVFHAMRAGTRNEVGSPSSSLVIDRWNGRRVRFAVQCQAAPR